MIRAAALLAAALFALPAIAQVDPVPIGQEITRQGLELGLGGHPGKVYVPPGQGRAETNLPMAPK